jgi:hypothetical protein
VPGVVWWADGHRRRREQRIERAEQALSAAVQALERTESDARSGLGVDDLQQAGILAGERLNAVEHAVEVAVRLGTRPTAELKAFRERYNERVAE